MSDLNVAAEVWLTVKEHITKNTAEVADDVVNTLIDVLGYSADDIKNSDFWHDKDIKDILLSYNVETDEDEDFEDEDEDEDENYWEEDED